MVDEEKAVTARAAGSGSRSRRVRASAQLGFIVAIVGVAIWAFGAGVLPYAGPSSGWPSHTSLLAATIRPWPQAAVTSLLVELFSALWLPGILLAASILGLRSAHRERHAFVLLGACAIWFTRVPREIMGLGRSPIDLGPLGARTIDMGICLALAGSVIATASFAARRKHLPAGGEAGPAIPNAPLGASARRGMALTLGGAFAYVSGSFLPYTHLTASALRGLGMIPASAFPLAMRSHPLAQGLLDGGLVGGVSRGLSIYGSALIVAIAAIGALAWRHRGRWSSVALGATLAWCAGVPFGLWSPQQVRLAGLWLTQLSIVLACAGAVVAAMDLRERSTSMPTTIAGMSPANGN